MTAAAELERGLAALREGRMADAERALRRALGADPDSVDAMQALGTALTAQGRAGEALGFLDRARALRPSPAVLHNRALALFQMQRFAEAQGDLEAAVAQAPAQHASWNLLGSVRAALGDAQRASEAYARALELRPDHAETHFNLALLHHAGGRLDAAIASYRAALALRPGLESARAKLAMALNEQGFEHFRARRIEPAIAAYRASLDLRSDFHEARNNLGAALAAAGRHGEAIQSFRAVLAARPADAGVLSNLGYSLQANGDNEGARHAFESALAIEPDHAQALANLGFLLQDEARLEEAGDLYARALAADPESAMAAYNLGFLRLCERRFAEGFPLLENRYRTTPPMTMRRATDLPEFGERDWGAGHRTAIWGEQGVGDRILYATLLPDFASRGEAFVFETDARLVPAFARTHPDWTVVTRERSDAAFAACDRGIANPSLAPLMRRSLADFDRQPRALLAADAKRAAGYRADLADSGKRMVGISWRSFQSAARGAVQRRKSAALADLEKLAKRDDLRLVDLQYGDTAAEREAFARAGGRLARHEGLDLFNDIDGVLAAIEACDAVVTTSNVTAHFAGALGKRVLLVHLGGVPPFHYWVTDASGRCLWYPSMRIVADAALDTWEKAFARAAELLED